MFRRLKFTTAGESHGPALIGVLEGLPAGLPIDSDRIQTELRRRQIGYGRGLRMKIEDDRIEFLAGVRHGETLGSPVALRIENRDWPNWQSIMDPFLPPDEPDRRMIQHPRPGHADLAGGVKYGHRDLRNVLERASARETAMRVALGALAKILLAEFGIEIRGFIRKVGPIGFEETRDIPDDLIRTMDPLDILPCPDPRLREAMITAIDRARDAGDTLGGVIEVRAWGVPPGLGSYSSWEQRLDARLAAILMAVPAVKGVHIGLGPTAAERPGSEIHDEIFYTPDRGFYRKTNRAGGIEGGVSNGEPIIVRLYKKPLPTLRKPLQSVDIVTKQPHRAAYERSDTTAIVPAVVIAEACLALVLADAFLEKFGGDHLKDVRASYSMYQKRMKTYPEWPDKNSS